jgi:hypothetical protein
VYANTYFKEDCTLSKEVNIFVIDFHNRARRIRLLIGDVPKDYLWFFIPYTKQRTRQIDVSLNYLIIFNYSVKIDIIVVKKF